MECNSTFFTNSKCEYYPCHKLEEGEDMNCMFCYCPLYALGRDCGGDFRITAKGVKDCSDCVRPHGKDGYEYVRARVGRVIDMVRESKDKETQR